MKAVVCSCDPPYFFSFGRLAASKEERDSAFSYRLNSSSKWAGGSALNRLEKGGAQPFGLKFRSAFWRLPSP